MLKRIPSIRGPVRGILDIRGPVDTLLKTIAPRPGEQCPDVDNCSPACENCESCRDNARLMHMRQCLTKDIPILSEALRLERICNQIQDTANVHDASAIAAAKQQYGLDKRKFKYTLPCMNDINTAWIFFLFSHQYFFRTLTAYLIASWKHASFNMYELTAETDEPDTDGETDELVTEAEMLKRKDRAYQEMCEIVKIIDDNVDRIIQMISHTSILSKDYRGYKKLLKKCGFDVVCETDMEEMNARKKNIDALSITIALKCSKFQILQVKYDAMKPAYDKLIDACKVDFVGEKDNDEIVARKGEFRALEGTFLQKCMKLRNLQEHLDALKKKQRKALERLIQDAESRLAQLE
jgi:hypothetical protein